MNEDEQLRLKASAEALAVHVYGLLTAVNLSAASIDASINTLQQTFGPLPIQLPPLLPQQQSAPRRLAPPYPNQQQQQSPSQRTPSRKKRGSPPKARGGSQHAHGNSNDIPVSPRMLELLDGVDRELQGLGRRDAELKARAPFQPSLGERNGRTQHQHQREHGQSQRSLHQEPSLNHMLPDALPNGNNNNSSAANVGAAAVNQTDLYRWTSNVSTTSQLPIEPLQQQPAALPPTHSHGGTLEGPPSDTTTTNPSAVDTTGVGSQLPVQQRQRQQQQVFKEEEAPTLAQLADDQQPQPQPQPQPQSGHGDKPSGSGSMGPLPPTLPEPTSSSGAAVGVDGDGDLNRIKPLPADQASSPNSEGKVPPPPQPFFRGVPIDHVGIIESPGSGSDGGGGGGGNAQGGAQDQEEEEEERQRGHGGGGGGPSPKRQRRVASLGRPKITSDR